MTRRRLAFWVLFAVTAAIYLVMVAWSLPTVAEAAGGLVPFDMRPTGYSFEEAEAFLAALSPQGTAFYLNVQQRLDTLYPALLAATLFIAIRTLAPPSRFISPAVLALIAIPGSVFDYLENMAVSSMLRAGASDLTPELAAYASRWTLLKSTFTTVAMLVLVALAAKALWRNIERTRNA